MRRLFPLMLVLMVGSSGCATLRGKDDLSWLRGKPVLIVAEGAGAAAAAVEARTERSLALAPVRVHPTSADGELRTLLALADDRTETARSAAEERRIPWLLIRTEAGARVENTRGGAVRWEVRLPGRERDQRLVQAVVSALGGAAPLDSASVRLASAYELAGLRNHATARDWDTHRAELTRLEETYPADPAVRVHGLLFGRGDTATAELSVTKAMNPEGETELSAIALASDAAGNGAVSLVAYEAAVVLFPERSEYRVGLADARMAVHGAEEAVAALRGGFDGTFETPALQSEPHERPDALPHADMRFHLGWYLARTGAFESSVLAYERAGDIYEAMGRPREQSDAMNNAGVSLVEGERPALAVAILRRALKLRRVHSGPAKAATTRYNLGRALSDAGRVEDALSAYAGAAEEYDSLGRASDALETRIETLALHARQGRRVALEEAAEKLLVALEDGGDDRPLAADVWFELGAARMAFADHEGALDAFAAAAEGYDEAGRMLEKAQTLYSMATPHVALYRFVAAHGDLVGALELAIRLDDTGSVVAIRRQLEQVRELIRMRGELPPALPPNLRSGFDP